MAAMQCSTLAYSADDLKEGMAALTAELDYMFTEKEVPEEIRGILGKLHVKTIQVFSALAEDAEGVGNLHATAATTVRSELGVSTHVDTGGHVAVLVGVLV